MELIDESHPNISVQVLLTVPYKSFCSADKENLVSNQDLLWFVIVSFDLISLMFVVGLMLLGEFIFLSLSGVKVVDTYAQCKMV